jgi:hypothetical protein
MTARSRYYKALFPLTWYVMNIETLDKALDDQERAVAAQELRDSIRTRRILHDVEVIDVDRVYKRRGGVGVSAGDRPQARVNI